jgi:hypothetical protein
VPGAIEMHIMRCHAEAKQTNLALIRPWHSKTVIPALSRRYYFHPPSTRKRPWPDASYSIQYSITPTLQYSQLFNTSF